MKRNKAIALFIRRLFDKTAPKPPADLMTTSVQMISNISYGKERETILDLYIPKRAGSYPLIVWVHGGGFVGGDKGDTMHFARAIAKHGYAVASINYTRAPEAKYPTPILQTDLAYDFLINEDYQGKDKIDTKQLFLAGDSAGAHIAMQYALQQPKGTLKGVLLYCGLYMVEETDNIRSRILRLMLRHAQLAYFGAKDFTKHEILPELDILGQVTKDFPPTFITDGNLFSFQEQGKALSNRLVEVGVAVTPLFFGKNSKTRHEYQFYLKQKEARQALDETITFLEKHAYK